MPSILNAPSADLLQAIPLSARVILDVGCGDGGMGAAYLAMNPTARYLGIEKDPAVAAIASEHLTEVAVVDVETTPIPFALPNGVDCIVYTAILEQLRDPWAVLRRHAEILAPNGMMLLCLPNLEHWSFVERLLRGTWDYAESGLLDQAHLRWFTFETTRRALLDLGLVPCDVRPRVFDGEHAAQFADALMPGLAALGIERDDFLRRSQPLQYIWRVRKLPREPITVGGNMLNPVGGVSHVRVIQPIQAIGTEPMVAINLSGRFETAPATDGHARIFILHRPILFGEEGRALLRTLMDAGWLIITEYDDNPDYFQVMQGDAELTFLGVHAVQTSTPALAEVLRRRNPEIAVFPNAVATLPPVRNFADPDVLTLFFGALNREQDWHELVPIINDIAARVGPRLRFQVLHDEGFFHALTSPHKTFTPLCDYDTYLRLLGEAEISFMPLSDNGFNRAKSDLKFIEAASCRVASLSSTVVYGDSIDDGRTGLLFRDPLEFRAQLTRLVEEPGLARALGDAARAYVSAERMLAYQVAPRLAWYRSLWLRREALTVALRDRVIDRLSQG